MVLVINVNNELVLILIPISIQIFASLLFVKSPPSQCKVKLSDGNTVNVMKERNNFLTNSLEYQYGLNSIDGLIKGMRKAIAGGNS